MLPQEFVSKWRGNTSSERRVYQQHFLDLCALVGHGTPAALDPESKFFTFEAGVAKLGGGRSDPTHLPQFEYGTNVQRKGGGGCHSIGRFVQWRHAKTYEQSRIIACRRTRGRIIKQIDSASGKLAA